MRPMLSQLEAEKKSLDVGIKLVDTYSGSHKQVLFECPNCHKHIYSIPSNVWHFKTIKCNCNQSIYEQLNDEEFLYNLYVVNKKSTLFISKQIGCGPYSVQLALDRFSIPVRNKSTGFTINNPPIHINKQLIDGCLLGDAHLEKSNKNSDIVSTRFTKKNIYYNHVLLITKSFYDIRIAKERVKKYTGLQQTGKIHSHYYFTTYSEPILNTYFDRWYPKWNNYKKIIPEDLIIDEELLLHWFLDDGTTTFRKRNSKLTNSVLLRFCTDCFPKNQQEKLCIKINNKYNLGIRVCPIKSGKYFNIKIPLQNNIRRFYDIIGPPPVSELAYKWKY